MVQSKSIFITGCAGFIGFHLARHLLARGDRVFGCDNFNDYYSPKLKLARAEELEIPVSSGDICTPGLLDRWIEEHQITHLVHLAAQAGVRHSLTHPENYVQANLVGFFQILETLRRYPHVKLIYASSSSVYGCNRKIPFSENDPTDSPANLYGATKKSNELMANSYSALYGINVIGLRFFTVYGPWGRPDMAYFSFTKAILEEKPIQLFNLGKMQRDFTYIDDIIQGTVAAIDRGEKNAVYNLGNSKPEELVRLVEIIEKRLGKKAHRQLLPMPQGEIPTTYADIKKASEELGYAPKTSLEVGMGRFLDWYLLNQLGNESRPTRLVTRS